MSKSSKGQQSRKRPAKQPEDFFWDCSVCTYKNNPEAFKCVMCDVRKGTSTRKSRINPDLVAVQVQHALLPPPLPPKLLAGMSREAEEAEEEQEEQEEQEEVNDSHEMPPPASPAEEQPSPSTSSAPAPSTAKGAQKKTPVKPKSAKPTSSRSKFKNVDRKNAVSTEITVDNVTVMITEYKLKVKKEKKDSHSSGSSVVGEPPSTINDDSLERPGPSSKTGSGAESEAEGGRGAGQARQGSEEMETTRSS